MESLSTVYSKCIKRQVNLVRALRGEILDLDARKFLKTCIEDPRHCHNKRRLVADLLSGADRDWERSKKAVDKLSDKINDGCSKLTTAKEKIHLHVNPSVNPEDTQTPTNPEEPKWKADSVVGRLELVNNSLKERRGNMERVLQDDSLSAKEVAELKAIRIVTAELLLGAEEDFNQSRRVMREIYGSINGACMKVGRVLEILQENIGRQGKGDPDLKAYQSISDQAKGPESWERCAWCSFMTNCQNTMQEHLHSTHGGREWVCTDCGQRFSFQTNLRRHLRTKQRKQDPVHTRGPKN